MELPYVRKNVPVKESRKVHTEGWGGGWGRLTPGRRSVPPKKSREIPLGRSPSGRRSILPGDSNESHWGVFHPVKRVYTEIKRDSKEVHGNEVTILSEEYVQK